jgi:hypothetical protein
MKKTTIFIALVAGLLSLASCDYILKPKSKSITNSDELKDVFLGEDSDSNGCVASAGYRWSKINKACIRTFEKGIRLIPANQNNDINEDEVDLAMVNAYLLFNVDKTEAEVFLGDEKESMVMKKTFEDIYEYERWKLFTNGQYKLEELDILKYISPVATEKQIESDLEYEMSDAVITQ